MLIEINCEIPEKCDFFKHYKTDAEVVNPGWIRMYCESQEKIGKIQTKANYNGNRENPLRKYQPNWSVIVIEYNSTFKKSEIRPLNHFAFSFF